MLQGASVDSSHVAAAPLYSAAADLVFKPDIGPRRTASYRINGYCFRTTIFERSIAQGLERLLRPFAIDADGPMLEFTVEPASGSALMVCIDGVEKIRSDLENEIIGAMFQAIIESAYGNPQWLSILHSGAVIRDGRALLLTGQSGSGKTTLTAYLSATGFTYAADDMAALVAPDGLLAPWPVTQTLRPASWGALSEVIPQLVDIPVCASWKGEIKYFASPPRASPQELFPVQVILFPRYDAAAKTELVQLRPLEALQRILGDRVWLGHPLRASNVHSFLAWLEHTPAYALHYKELDAARALIVDYDF